MFKVLYDVLIRYLQRKMLTQAWRVYHCNGKNFKVTHFLSSFSVIRCFSSLFYSGNIWCSPEHACLFLVTHINCSSGAYTMEKRVSSVLLKEFQAYLSVIYVTCNTRKRFENFFKIILFEGREDFFFLSRTVAL